MDLLKCFCVFDLDHRFMKPLFSVQTTWRWLINNKSTNNKGFTSPWCISGMFSSPQNWLTGSSWGQFHRPGWSPICWHHCLPQYPLFPLDSGKERKQSEFKTAYKWSIVLSHFSNTRTRIIASQLYVSTHHSSCSLHPCLSKLMYSM